MFQNVHTSVYNSHYFTGDTPCPLFENDEIIQQPADFLTLSETYSTAATSYIHHMAGTFMYYYIVTVLIYHFLVIKCHNSRIYICTGIHTVNNKTFITFVDFQ